MRYLIGLTLLLLATLAHAAPTTRPLAEVASADELDKQPAINLPGGGTVKLGIGPLDPEMGPWRLVYAKFEGELDKKPHFEGRVSGDAVWLGSLQVRCDWEDQRRAVEMIKMIGQERAKSTDPDRCIVPVLRSGKAVIRVQAGKGEEIAALPIEVKDPIPSPWRTFAAARHQAGPQKFVVSDHGVAMIPRMESFGGGAMKHDNIPNGTTRPAEPLTLSLADGVFEIESNVGPLMNWADESLLARWWVDGKLRMPTGKMQAMQQSMQRMVGTTRLFRIDYALPDDLADLKPGTKVAVQVMYCSGGKEFAPVGGTQMMQQKAMTSSPSELLLSNRLEFVIPAAK